MNVDLGLKDLTNDLRNFTHSHINNYVLPGMTSSLITETVSGRIRMFTNSRIQTSEVIPHSHRFHFSAYVLRGEVTNILWEIDPLGDEFGVCNQKGMLGNYQIDFTGEINTYIQKRKTYTVGQGYHMEFDQIHSIWFSADAILLIFEGPICTSETQILQPYVNNKLIETFRVEKWMFQREVD